MFSNVKLPLSTLVIFLIFIASCASPARLLCNYEYCGQDEWQTAINRIYLANFPEDEPYEGVLWKDNFMNAWVTDGNKVNITALMLYELGTPSRRAAVAAHELAHLKQGHYYTKLGMAIIANAMIITGEAYMPYSSQVTGTVANWGLAAFSRSHASEADRLAIQYLRKANYKKEDFLDLLRWMQDTLPDRVFDPLLRTHPHISERIRSIEALDDEKVIETPMLKAHLTPHKNFK